MQKLTRLFGLSCLLPLSCLDLYSQSATQPRGWISYFGDHRLGKAGGKNGFASRWGVHFDGQYRASWADGYTQLPLRPGLNF